MHVLLLLVQFLIFLIKEKQGNNWSILYNQFNQKQSQLTCDFIKNKNIEDSHFDNRLAQQHSRDITSSCSLNRNLCSGDIFQAPPNPIIVVYIHEFSLVSSKFFHPKNRRIEGRRSDDGSRTFRIYNKFMTVTAKSIRDKSRSTLSLRGRLNAKITHYIAVSWQPCAPCLRSLRDRLTRDVSRNNSIYHFALLFPSNTRVTENYVRRSHLTRDICKLSLFRYQ